MKSVPREFAKRADAPAILRQSKGRVFTVNFVKRTDGEVRTMNCRSGVSKGVTGVGRTFDPNEHGLMSVYDMQVRDYRMINLDHILTAQVDGTEYIFY